jgi:hypothetical protein
VSTPAPAHRAPLAASRVYPHHAARAVLWVTLSRQAASTSPLSLSLSHTVPASSIPNPKRRFHTVALTASGTARQGGEVVRWGAGTRVDSHEHCCSLCSKFEPASGGKECNVWVWCADEALCGADAYHNCWLKHQVRRVCPSLSLLCVATNPNPSGCEGDVGAVRGAGGGHHGAGPHRALDVWDHLTVHSRPHPSRAGPREP